MLRFGGGRPRRPSEAAARALASAKVTRQQCQLPKGSYPVSAAAKIVKASAFSHALPANRLAKM
jgi:hypothetical protein